MREQDHLKKNILGNRDIFRFKLFRNRGSTGDEYDRLWVYYEAGNGFKKIVEERNIAEKGNSFIKFE